ncbi:hypothetical protein J4429_00640 [Candidatus Pacearchaeota archaeon]|nr:hypothetical protein [Candidatus Pacearchaeota archaeon]
MITEKISLNQCSRYNNCRTGRDLPPEFCARYKCNTFYQIDTIAIHNRIYEYLRNRNGKDINHKIEEDISRIVQEAIREMSSN